MWNKYGSDYEWYSDKGLYDIKGRKGNRHQSGHYRVYFTPLEGKRTLIAESEFIDYAKRCAHEHYQSYSK